jgi:aspartate dehydrogenase
MSLTAQRRSAQVVLLGLGAINRRVAGLLRSRQSAATVVGVIVRRPESLTLDVIEGAATIACAADLIAVAPDIVVEAASVEAVHEWGDIALRNARRFVVSSASAFTDDKLLRHLRETAKQAGSQLVLSAGALAGASSPIPDRAVTTVTLAFSG